MSNVSRKARESGVGRLLLASLHQAIGDVIPMRLEFYEHWLRPGQLHQGVMGRAPLSAVLGFLRTEPAYEQVVARGGVYAADWDRASRSDIAVQTARVLPAPLAGRIALYVAGRLVRATTFGGRTRATLAGDTGSMEIHGSVFCDVREPVQHPFCGYYAAMVSRVLEHFGIDGAVRITACRGAANPTCVLAFRIRGHSTPGGEPQP